MRLFLYPFAMARRSYTPQFVQQLVREVLEEFQPLTQVAHKWNVHPGVLSKWVKAKRPQVRSEGTEENEVQALRSEIKELRDRTELLRGMLEKLYRSKYIGSSGKCLGE